MIRGADSAARRRSIHPPSRRLDLRVCRTGPFELPSYPRAESRLFGGALAGLFSPLGGYSTRFCPSPIALGLRLQLPRKFGVRFCLFRVFGRVSGFFPGSLQCHFQIGELTSDHRFRRCSVFGVLLCFFHFFQH